MKITKMDPYRLAIKKTCKQAKVVNYIYSDVICKKTGERIRNRKICLEIKRKEFLEYNIIIKGTSHKSIFYMLPRLILDIISRKKYCECIVKTGNYYMILTTEKDRKNE